MTSAADLAKAIIKSKEPDKKGNGSGSDKDDELEVAAGNFSSAVKSGDSSEMASSLREFISLCKKD